MLYLSDKRYTWCFLFFIYFTFCFLTFSPARAATHTYAPIIHNLYDLEIKPFLNEDIILKDIKKQQKRFQDYTEADFLALNTQWHQELDDGFYTLLPELLTKPSAIIISRIEELAKGVISSISIVDTKGLAVSQSHVTQNYWHANTPLWQNIKHKNATDIYIHEVVYDPMSLSFIVTAAFPILNEANEKYGYLFVDFDALELELIAEALPYTDSPKEESNPHNEH